MFENKSYFKIKSGSNRNFGLVFSFIFFLISIYLLTNNEKIYSWFLFFSIILFIISIFFAKILEIPNKLWFKLGLFLGSIFSPIIMGLIFFISVVPTGIIMKLFGKDLLKTRNKHSSSLWIKRSKSIGSMKNQF